MKKSTYQDVGPAGPCAMSYTDWGDADNPNVVFCVHGLTRNSRDFDALAEVLSKTYRVISVDVAGRGESQWLKNPADYTYPTYCPMIWRLIMHLGVKNLDWIGTSMGGIIGMMIAAMPGNPINRMIINDVGPFLPKEALQRINAYLSMDFDFASLADIERHLRKVHEPFGPLTDQQWAHMAKHSSRQDENGNWCLSYDPAIKEPFKDVVDDDIAFWEIWDAIRCPILLLRGETSDILLRQTADEMLLRGPETQLVELPGIGHAPALMSDEQISTMEKWLSTTKQK